MELLQLRRDRVVRADSVIDKNQALILSAPNLLPRLMELLRVMNFNPPLAVFGESHRAHSHTHTNMQGEGVNRGRDMRGGQRQKDSQIDTPRNVKGVAMHGFTLRLYQHVFLSSLLLPSNRSNASYLTRCR